MYRFVTNSYSSMEEHWDCWQFLSPYKECHLMKEFIRSIISHDCTDICKISFQKHSDCVRGIYTWNSECEIGFPGGSSCHTATVSSEHTLARAYQHSVSSILFSVFANLIGKNWFPSVILIFIFLIWVRLRIFLYIWLSCPLLVFAHFFSYWLLVFFLLIWNTSL